MQKLLVSTLLIGINLALGILAHATDLKVGDAAPLFKVKTHLDADFDLSSRKGQWTVLYFYPKADTPGCTKQACAFRDAIDNIRKVGADVFGVSADSVANQKAFHEKFNLKFTLLADADGAIIKAYGTKMPIITMSHRWTFIVGPDLKIRAIEKDVDPALDAKKVMAKIEQLKNETATK